MLTRLIIPAALLLYVLAVGCALTQSHGAEPTTHSSENYTPVPLPTSQGSWSGLPFCGAGMQIQRVDWIEQYKKSIDEVAAIGGDTILLVIDTRMENGTS